MTDRLRAALARWLRIPATPRWDPVDPAMVDAATDALRPAAPPVVDGRPAPGGRFHIGDSGRPIVMHTGVTNADALRLDSTARAPFRTDPATLTAPRPDGWDDLLAEQRRLRATWGAVLDAEHALHRELAAHRAEEERRADRRAKADRKAVLRDRRRTNRKARLTTPLRHQWRADRKADR